LVHYAKTEFRTKITAKAFSPADSDDQNAGDSYFTTGTKGKAGTGG
jgi:hypothetical protein